MLEQGDKPLPSGELGVAFTVLVVEDDPLVRKMFRVALQKEGVDVLEAPSGERALALTREHSPNLILADQVLPDTTGIDLIRKLRELPESSDVPIIAMSGMEARIELARTIRGGYTDFLSKPVEASRLLEIVHTYLPDRTFESSDAQRTVVLVDNDPIQLKLATLRLKAAGFDVIQARDGREALELAREHHPVAILSDVLMPRLNGFGLSTEVRADPELAAIPVILFSAMFIEAEDQASARSAGANALVARSPDFGYAIEALQLHLEQPGRNEQTVGVSVSDESMLERTIVAAEREAELNTQLIRRLTVREVELSVLARCAAGLIADSAGGLSNDVLQDTLSGAGISMAAIFSGAVHTLRLHSYFGFAEPSGNLRSFFGCAEILEQALQTGQPQELRRESATTAAAQHFFAENGLHALLVTPLVIGEERLGVLVTPAQAANSNDHQTFLPAIASQLGIALALSRAVRNLEGAEHRLSLILDTVTEGVVVINTDGRLTFANAAAERLLSLSGSQLKGEYYLRIFGPDWFPGIVTSGKGVANLEIDLHRPDGTDLPVLLSASPLVDERKELHGVVASFADLRGRRSAEQALRTTQNRLASTQRIAHLGNFELNVMSGEVTWSEEMYNILGHSLQDQQPRQTDFLAYVHSGDRGMLESAFEQSLSTLRPFTVEHRIVRSDGTTRWVETSGSAVTPQTGEPTRIIGTMIDITQRKNAEEHLALLAYRDHVTNLPNRRSLMDHAEHELATAARENQTVALMYLDLDQFQIINDTMGHVAGDQLLKTVGERLSARAREGDVVARLGDDEFALLLGGLEDTKHLPEFVKETLNEFELPFTVDGAPLHVTACIGISVSPENAFTASELIRQAATAMREAKLKGKNSFQFFTRSMHAAAVQRLSLENDLRQALNEHQLLVYYQPIINIRTGAIVGAECLVRWKRSKSGVVGPDRFVPLAEETGLIIPIGRWVFSAVCDYTRKLVPYWEDGFKMTVNVSPRELGEPGFPQSIHDMLSESGTAPGTMEIEVTETALAGDVQQVASTLSELKKDGVDISLDDFGTGYCSLTYLKQFPIDTLKIDKTFVRDICTDDRDLAIAKTMVTLGHSMNLRVVAEGVETKEQLMMLSKIKCDCAQGYYFGRPMPGPVFQQMLSAY